MEPASPEQEGSLDDPYVKVLSFNPDNSTPISIPMPIIVDSKIKYNYNRGDEVVGDRIAEPSAKDKPAEDKPAEDKPAEDKPAKGEPVEGGPAEDKPVEDKPTRAGYEHNGKTINTGAEDPPEVNNSRWEKEILLSTSPAPAPGPLISPS
jgi:hypothetical protein